MSTRTAELVALSPRECLRLLRGHVPHIGRMGFTARGGQPLVIPVNYHVDGNAVVFRTEPESLLASHAVDRRVAFEVDEVDGAWLEGWSVLIQGTAWQVTDVAELDRLRRLPLHPWAPGERSLYVRVEPMVVTGRKIT